MYWIVQPVYRRIPEADYVPTGVPVAINSAHVLMVELGKVTLKIRMTNGDEVIVRRADVPWLLSLLSAMPMKVV